MIRIFSTRVNEENHEIRSAEFFALSNYKLISCDRTLKLLRLNNGKKSRFNSVLIIQKVTRTKQHHVSLTKRRSTVKIILKVQHEKLRSERYILVI